MTQAAPRALEPEASPLTATQWLICVIAAIGFAFDIYELLMLPLIIQPALSELARLQPGTTAYASWAAFLFYVPAFAGGIFGLLGGYLTDRFGRRRVLTASILLYAVSAFLAGFSTSLWMLLILRCTTFVGVCVEFVAAVAWLAELFPNPRQREKVIGYTQACSSLGGFLVAIANGIAIHYAVRLPGIPDFLHIGGTIHDAHAPWRYTLMSGLIPAIPLILIRPFLPESPAWRAKKEAGALKRPSIAELFSPSLRRTTIVTTIMFACSYGAAFGAIQMVREIVPGLPETPAKVQEKARELTAKAAATRPNVKPEAFAKPAAGLARQELTRSITTVQEVGGLAGRVLLAVLALYVTSRRKLVRIFLVPGLIAMPIVFGICAVKGLNLFYVGIFVAGFFTVAQFSFWGNYLPTAYPLHLRGTGESFAANIGGRMIGTSFAAVTVWVAAWYTAKDASPAAAAHIVAYTAAAVGLAVYIGGLVASFFLPEPSEPV